MIGLEWLAWEVRGWSESQGSGRKRSYLSPSVSSDVIRTVLLFYNNKKCYFFDCVLSVLVPLDVTILMLRRETSMVVRCLAIHTEA